MSRNYDNWERLVAAVLKREEIWELCHQPSRTPSICSDSSDNSSTSFRFSDVSMLEKNEESEQLPVPKLIFVDIPLKYALKSTPKLGNGRFRTSILTHSLQDVQLSDHDFVANGTQLVMKKLLNESATEEETKQKMMVLGNCRHENVASPKAYYFSHKANGKFVLNAYCRQGSVSDMLRGFLDCLSWGSHLKVAGGAARGIARIRRQCGGKMAHGNIKSSNIFLNSQQYGCVSDFGLAGIIVKPRNRGALDYCASEYEFKNASKENDVYTFGVVLPELLTGKPPTENLDIVSWSRCIGPEKWMSRLFDGKVRRTMIDEKDTVDIVRRDTQLWHSDINIMESRESFRSYNHSMDLQMVEMMYVAVRCLAIYPKDRPKMFDIVLILEKIENLKDR